MDATKVGVRTRAEALDMVVESSGQTKRRKVDGGELALSSSSLTDELNNFCQFSGAFISYGDATAAANDSQYLNFSSDGSASCCSSNRAAEEALSDHLNFTDLEKVSVVETGELSSTKYDSSQSEETTTLNQQTGETFEPESTSCRGQIKLENIMPLEAELEEFFAVAEKNLRKQFTDKYNYDISKDEPLGGRYEWIPLKP